MNEPEKLILQGMYAAGFRYIVREKQTLLFSDEKFIKTAPGTQYKWDLPIESYGRIDDLGGKADKLFDWIKDTDEEAVEISRALNESSDNLSN